MEPHIQHEEDEKNSREDDDQRSISEDRLRSSSSVSSTSDIESSITDFTLEEQEQIDRHDHGSFAIDHEQDDDAPEVHFDASALQSPTVQTMERPAESSSGYRIPSYVFARNKSSNPEWSVASNESLFSIHTGNMSFTRDQFSWLLKSGELGIYGTGDLPARSGELPPLSPRYVSTPVEPKPPIDTHKEEHIPVSSHQHKEEQRPVSSYRHNEKQKPVSSPKALKPGEEIIAAHFKTSASTLHDNKGDDLRGMTNKPHVSESSDSGTEVKKDDHISETKEKRSSVSTTPSDDIPLTNSKSHHSDASGQSFAFPVLAEIGRDKSVNSAQSHVRVEQPKKTTTVHNQEANKSPKPAMQEVTHHHTSSSWFSSCFRCCCCSSCYRSCCCCCW